MVSPETIWPKEVEAELWTVTAFPDQWSLIGDALELVEEGLRVVHVLVGTLVLVVAAQVAHVADLHHGLARGDGVRLLGGVAVLISALLDVGCALSGEVREVTATKTHVDQREARASMLVEGGTAFGRHRIATQQLLLSLWRWIYLVFGHAL